MPSIPVTGFLAENAAFARRCAEAGSIFVGPRPELLELFGDKGRARALAQQLGIPVLAGTSGPTNLEEAKGFLASLTSGAPSNSASVMVKAVSGGGGRGMRIASTSSELEQAYAQCSVEALSAFANGDLYVERFLTRARHVEVQVIGDGHEVIHLGERECSLQRRRQKLVEITPAPGLSLVLRERLTAAALRLARETSFNSAGTFEFLVDADTETFWFLEANPRLQVEHTITEEITGIDIVKAQLMLASGRSLDDLDLKQSHVKFRPGFAMELRINAETFDREGRVQPSHGVIAAYDAPSGPGIRIDTAGHTGFHTNPRFDPLLAKLVTYSPSSALEDLMLRASRALYEFCIDGISTNIPLLVRLLQHPDVRSGRFHTQFVEEHIPELLPKEVPAARIPPVATAGDKQSLPLAVGPEGTIPVASVMQATVVSIDV